MYRVTLTHLAPDARRVRATGDALDLGDISSSELTVLLDAFVSVDPVQNEEHDPHVIAAGRGAKLIVRTSRGRLQVYDVRDHAAPGMEMSVAEILDRLDRLSDTRSPFPKDGADEPELPAPTAPHRGIALAMLIVGLVLNGYILYSVFYVESVNKAPEVKLLTDANEAKSRAVALAGFYSTGSHIGDRVIEVDVTGWIRFYEIGSKGPINENRDSYRIGRHDGLLCLSTEESGVVDLVGENLVYYRDVYQKKRQGP